MGRKAFVYAGLWQGDVFGFRGQPAGRVSRVKINAIAPGFSAKTPCQAGKRIE